MNLQDEVTPSINPGDDFYNYVNQKWRDAHPIPADKPRVSTFNDLDEAVTEQLHRLFKKATTGSETRNAQLARKLYRSGMDMAAIEKRGIEPVLPLVEEIKRLKDSGDIRQLITSYHADGRGLLRH